MKGVLLLGGSGSRLYPLTEVCNKHLVNVGGKPMAQWNVEKLVFAGVTDLLIITGGEHVGSIASYFKGGSKFGCNITYKIQEKAGGIAEALKLVDGFVEPNEKFIVILGDNIFKNDLVDVITQFNLSPNIKTVLLYKSVDDANRFGVIDHHKSIIVEKPEIAPSNHAVVGIYGYTYDQRFKGILHNLEVSERGELEVTDLNNGLINGVSHAFHELDGWWTDAGTHKSLELANKFIYE